MICFQNNILIQKNCFLTERLRKPSLATSQTSKKKTLVFSSSKFYFDEAKEIKKNRQKINLPLDNILLDLQSKDMDDSFLKFCFLNRDNISYSLLYQITALKLKGEETDNNSSRSIKIKELRKKILENIQIIDQPITQSLIVSEKTVKELLSQENLTSGLDRFVKKNKLDVSSLWIVLTAAISAWKNKIRIDEDDTAKSTLERLTKIKKNVFSNDDIESLLAKELIMLDSFCFSETNCSTAEIESGILDGLKLLVCILEKLPKSSYGTLLGEISEFYNILLNSKFGIKSPSITKNGIQFSPKKITTDSRLAGIKDLSFKN